MLAILFAGTGVEAGGVIDINEVDHFGCHGMIVVNLQQLLMRLSLWFDHVAMFMQISGQMTIKAYIIGYLPFF
jgi:hypothetical protein